MNTKKNEKGGIEMEKYVEKNIRMDIMYDGTAFGGFQRIQGERMKEKHVASSLICAHAKGDKGELNLNSKNKSVQGYLEWVLSHYMQEEIRVIGSGRTDKGVHAIRQVVNFYTHNTVDLERAKEELNYSFNQEIQILDMYEVDRKFHSRYDAVRKTYQYRILNEEVPSVFLRKHTFHVPSSLNVNAMREGAKLLVGTHDFKGFSTFRKDVGSTVRTVYEIKIEEVITNRYGRNLKEIIITIEGNGFLYNMVRILVGTLIEIGEGKRNKESITDVLSNKQRAFSGPTVYGEGLYLLQVNYK